MIVVFRHISGIMISNQISLNIDSIIRIYVGQSEIAFRNSGGISVYARLFLRFLMQDVISSAFGGVHTLFSRSSSLTMPVALRRLIMSGGSLISGGVPVDGSG